MPYCSNPAIRMGRPLQSSRSAVTLIANGTIAPTELEHTLDSLVRVSRRVGHISITAIAWQHMCVRVSICAYGRTCVHTCAHAGIANDYMYTKDVCTHIPGNAHAHSPRTACGNRISQRHYCQWKRARPYMTDCRFNLSELVSESNRNNEGRPLN